jgi:hypothetical protein
VASKKKKKVYLGRDYLNLLIIQGVTKAGTHTDKKKESNKLKARKKVKHVEDEEV